jgi:hypothetical protein
LLHCSATDHFCLQIPVLDDVANLGIHQIALELGAIALLTGAAKVAIHVGAVLIGQSVCPRIVGKTKIDFLGIDFIEPEEL